MARCTCGRTARSRIRLSRLVLSIRMEGSVRWYRGPRVL